MGKLPAGFIRPFSYDGVAYIRDVNGAQALVRDGGRWYTRGIKRLMRQSESMLQATFEWSEWSTSSSCVLLGACYTVGVERRQACT